jgi:hypothetical protein
MERNHGNGTKKMVENVDSHVKISLTKGAKCCDGSHQATPSLPKQQNKARGQSKRVWTSKKKLKKSKKAKQRSKVSKNEDKNSMNKDEKTKGK